MTETRRVIYCPQCKHGWLVEDKKVEWAGDSRSLSQYEKELGRSRGECQCGLNLYSLEYKKKNGKRNKRKNISRNN